MNLRDFITDAKDIREIETYRRTMLAIYEPWADENVLAMEVLEMLWSMDLDELFGSKKDIEEAKRNVGIMRMGETSDDPYDFTNLSSLQLRGVFNSLWNQRIENGGLIDLVEFYFLILKNFNIRSNRSKGESHRNILWEMSNAIQAKTHASEDEAKFFVKNVYDEFVKRVAKEI